MSLRHVVTISSMILLVVMLSYAIALGVMGPLPALNVRKIAEIYLSNSFNPFNRYFSAMAPEAVTAIVWDFRGIDTLFEVSVFYLAIIATITLFREFKISSRKPVGLSIVAKTATRIIIVFILVVAAAVALHGHLTPGGGFQAGSIAAVAAALIIVTFSLYSFVRIGATKERLLALRSNGLMGIVLTALLLFILGLIMGVKGFIMQNQVKPISPLGLPYEIMGMITSGSCLIYNIFDALAVSMAFALLFTFISILESDVQEVIEKEREV